MTSSNLTIFSKRQVTEERRPGDRRDEFSRDRARVIHSAGFRRLQGKTQVMGVGEGDFHRTRLTHSVECAQIGYGLLEHVRCEESRSDVDPEIELTGIGFTRRLLQEVDNKYQTGGTQSGRLH